MERLLRLYLLHVIPLALDSGMFTLPFAEVRIGANLYQNDSVVVQVNILPEAQERKYYIGYSVLKYRFALKLTSIPEWNQARMNLRCLCALWYTLLDHQRNNLRYHNTHVIQHDPQHVVLDQQATLRIE